MANIQEGKYEDVLAAVQSPIIALTELVKNSADSCISKDNPIVISIDTKQRKITIADSGEGLPKDELEHLGEAGYSSKMIGSNTRSPINNPLSGSKGLGLLTAFFIAEILEIETYSVKDKKSYYLIWKKGEQKYTYDEAQRRFQGTTVTLKDIESEKLDMVLLVEEKIKLFMSSLNFFTEDEKLPRIKLFIDEIEESHYPSEALEKYYLKNKGKNSGFIAKAGFQYKDNRITLSYEDNVSDLYTFTEKSIDLTNKNSVDDFIREIHAPEKGSTSIKSICDSDVFGNKYRYVKIPAFSGVIYTWRQRKADGLEQWPVGVRIYINNYSLYRYLDKENDWLTLSEISQNVKATNYKLKNTYGYLDITDYNENNEQLKISKERNDFVDSMAQRKFIHIMRDIIVGTFARIDMAVKNPLIPKLSLRETDVTRKVGEIFNLSDIIDCNNIGLNDIELDYDESKLNISDDWIISTDHAGSYDIKLTLNSDSYTFVINYKKTIPQFDLKKNTMNLLKGNTVNLRDFIDLKSCKDVTPGSISISSKFKTTIINNDLFDKNNSVGEHVILYNYDDFQRTLTVIVKDIEQQPGSGARSPRIDALFPKLDDLRDHSFKLTELIDGISSYYVQVPTLCMAAIRILIESSTKSFFQSLTRQEAQDISFQSFIDKVFNIRQCNEKNNDYISYVMSKDDNFISEFKRISNEYNVILSKDGRKNIESHLKTIDLDMFVHNPNTISNNEMVYSSMKIFSPLLNYIFDILLFLKTK